MSLAARSIARGRRPRAKITDYASIVEIFDVDVGAGILTWRARHVGECRQNETWNKRYAGKRAGCRNSQGYEVVNINSAHHRVHHIVWLVATGSWPSLDIDHIDGDRTNNAITNLREVSRAENLRNKGITSRNTSGCVGVDFDRHKARWHARIYKDRVQYHLGTFVEFSEAVKARRAAEREFGYSPMHGRRPAHEA